MYNVSSLKIFKIKVKKMGKKYLNLALPSGFECIVGVLITMTDTFMISQFGSEIIASVGAMGTVIDFMYLVLQSINVSNNVIVARLLGKNDKEQAKITVGTALLIAIICSFICIILTMSISKFIPKMFLVNQIGLIYLYIRLIGVIPNTILTILGGYQRTLGNSRRMLDIRILCFFVNAILDFIFITLGFGITGVAVSTVLVEIINMLILIYYSKKLIKIKFVKSIVKEEFELIRYNIYERIFKRGSNFILNIIMSRIGAFQYAAHLIVMQFLDLINNFLHGIGIGTQTMIATAIGSDNNKKINETTKIVNKMNKKIVYTTTVIIGIAMIISLPYFLIEKESLVIGYKLLIFVLLDCILSGSYHYYSSILRAMKEFKYISKLSLFISGFLRLILAFVLSKIYGIYGVWICFIISDFIMNTLLNKRINKIHY
jgi:putative MATE family efflux protein